MTRSDTLRSEMARLEGTIAGLHKDLSREQKKADDATAAARKKRDEASRTKSDSTRRMALTAAERKEKEATTALGKGLKSDASSA